MEIFDVIKTYERCGVESYTEVPKTVTAVMHANLSDDTEFHCIWIGMMYDVVSGKQSEEGRPYCIKKIFVVRKQPMEIFWDPRYGMFYVVEVVPKFETPPLYKGKNFCLIVHTNGAGGFLATLDDFRAVLEEEKQRESEHAAAA